MYRSFVFWIESMCYNKYKSHNHKFWRVYFSRSACFRVLNLDAWWRPSITLKIYTLSLTLSWSKREGRYEENVLRLLYLQNLVRIMSFLNLKGADSLEKMWMFKLFHERKLSVKTITAVFIIFRLFNYIRLRVTVLHTFDSAIRALIHGHFRFEKFVKLCLVDYRGVDKLAKNCLGLSEQIVWVSEFSAHGWEIIWRKIHKSD